MQQTCKSWIKKNLFSAITIIFSIGTLAFFMCTESGIKNLRYVLFHLQPIWLLWIVVGVLVGWLLEGYIIHLFCRHLKKGWTFGQSFYVGMIGLFYSAITPFCMCEPMEIYYLTKMEMDAGTASSIVAVKSLVHHAVEFFFSLILISFELSYFQTRVNNFAFITVFGLISNSIFIAFVVICMINEKLTNSLLQTCVRFFEKIKMHKLSKRLSNRVHDELLLFHNGSKKIGKSYPLYFSAIFLTLAQITVASLISYFVYRSFSLKGESVFTMVAGDTFVMMVSTFIPLPGSSGGAEGGFYLFFHAFFGTAIIPAITLWRISTYHVNIIFGGMIAYFGRKKYTWEHKGSKVETKNSRD